MSKCFTLVLAGAASLALLAAPAALAQNAPPMGQPQAQGSTSGGSMSGMQMPKKKAAAKKPSGKMAMAGGMKLSCMDYAWQSQDEKDCEAGKIKPPNWR